MSYWRRPAGRRYQDVRRDAVTLVWGKASYNTRDDSLSRADSFTYECVRRRRVAGYDSGKAS
jgi:hypothetical protein